MSSSSSGGNNRNNQIQNNPGGVGGTGGRNIGGNSKAGSGRFGGGRAGGGISAALASLSQRNNSPSSNSPQPSNNNSSSLPSSSSASVALSSVSATNSQVSGTPSSAKMVAVSLSSTSNAGDSHSAAGAANPVHIDSLIGSIAGIGVGSSISGGSTLNPSQLDQLMRKIRSKASQYKSWNELQKLCQKTLQDKKLAAATLGQMSSAMTPTAQAAEQQERLQIQRCLDTIQKNMQITSLQSMVHRLETIARSMSGLKFTAGPSGLDCFISSEMFYVEVTLEQGSGAVKEVKVSHQDPDPIPCPELTRVLRSGNFKEFCRHLEGLSAIYALNADKKQKHKAYLALHALETDLSQLAQLQCSINDINNLIHKSPVGILEQRKGGYPMKLTYFVSPYDLLDPLTKSSLPLTTENVIEKQLGLCATVQLESSVPHKLQTTSLISVSKGSDGKPLPVFSALSNLNSTNLPACFVLRLSKPLPMSLDMVSQISNIIKIPDFATSYSQSIQPLIKLIARQQLMSLCGRELNAEEEAQLGGPFYVPLPDQHHAYYLQGPLTHLDGVMVDRIPFTHPTFVPQILVFLRSQALFNFIIGSCIRQTEPIDDPQSGPRRVFDLSALNMSSITVTFEHPADESLASVEFDIREITSLKCKLFTSTPESMASEDFASKILQKCWSIPLTMRAIIKKCHEKAQAMKQEAERQREMQRIEEQKQKQMSSQRMDAFSQLIQQGSGSLGQGIGTYKAAPMNGPNSQIPRAQLPSRGPHSMPGPGGDHVKGNQFQQQQLQQGPNQRRMSGASQNSNATVNQGNRMIPNHGQIPANSQRFSHPQQQHHIGLSQGQQPTSVQRFSGQQNALGNESLQQKQQMVRNLLTNQQSQPGVGQKPNAMLMSMLSDVPSANNGFNKFPIQHGVNNHGVGPVAPFSQTQPPTGTKKARAPRKRKNTGEPPAPPNSRSPMSASLPGRSPKRKFSEEEFNLITRQIPTPDVDFLDGIHSDGGSLPAIGNNKSRPASTPSSSSFDGLNIKQEIPSGPDLSGYQAFLAQQQQQQIQQVQSAPLVGPTSLSELLAGSNSGMDFDEFLSPGLGGGSKRTLKRMKSADGSEGSSGAGTEDEQTGILKSLEDLHGRDLGFLLDSRKSSGLSNSSGKMKAPKTPGTPSGSNDVDMSRRLSGGSDKKLGIPSFGNLGQGPGGPSGVDDPVDSGIFKKERKRKRAESIDSGKGTPSASPTSSGPPQPSLASLLPPENVSSSSQGALSVYNFDNSSNPVVRPMTLNVKQVTPPPSLMSAQALKSPSASKSKNSLVSSSTSKSGFKEKSLVKRPGGQSPRAPLDPDGPGNGQLSSSVSPKGTNSPFAPSSSTKMTKPKQQGIVSSSGTKSPMATSPKGLGIKSQNKLSKNANSSISSTSGIASGSQTGPKSAMASMATSPPVSSSGNAPSSSSGAPSGSSLASSSSGSKSPSSAAKQAAANSGLALGALPKTKKGGSLQAVLDRLGAGTSSSSGVGSTTGTEGKAESSSTSSGISISSSSPSSTSTNALSGSKADSSGAGPTSSRPNLKGAEKLKYTKSSDYSVKSSGKGGGDLKITIKRPSSANTSPSLPTSTSSSTALAPPNVSPELSYIFTKPQTTSKGFTIPKKKNPAPTSDTTTSSPASTTSSAPTSTQATAGGIKRPPGTMSNPPKMVSSGLKSGVSSTTSFSGPKSGASMGRVSSSGPPSQRPGQNPQGMKSFNLQGNKNLGGPPQSSLPGQQQLISQQQHLQGQPPHFSMPSPNTNQPQPRSQRPSLTMENAMYRPASLAEPLGRPLPGAPPSSHMTAMNIRQGQAHGPGPAPPGPSSAQGSLPHPPPISPVSSAASHPGFVSSYPNNASRRQQSSAAIDDSGIESTSEHRAPASSMPFNFFGSRTASNNTTPPATTSSSQISSNSTPSSASEPDGIPPIESPTESTADPSLAGVSSSSDVGKTGASSTPSSPAECLIIPTATPPPLIPTESVASPDEVNRPPVEADDDDEDRLILDINQSANDGIDSSSNGSKALPSSSPAEHGGLSGQSSSTSSVPQRQPSAESQETATSVDNTNEVSTSQDKRIRTSPPSPSQSSVAKQSEVHPTISTSPPDTALAPSHQDEIEGEEEIIDDEDDLMDYSVAAPSANQPSLDPVSSSCSSISTNAQSRPQDTCGTSAKDLSASVSVSLPSDSRISDSNWPSTSSSSTVVSQVPTDPQLGTSVSSSKPESSTLTGSRTAPLSSSSPQNSTASSSNRESDRISNSISTSTNAVSNSNAGEGSLSLSSSTSTSNQPPTKSQQQQPQAESSRNDSSTPASPTQSNSVSPSLSAERTSPSDFPDDDLMNEALGAYPASENPGP